MMYGCIIQASIHFTTRSGRPVCQTLDSGQDDKLSAPDGAVIEIWLKPD
jgi:hypothetical protein